MHRLRCREEGKQTKQKRKKKKLNSELQKSHNTALTLGGGGGVKHCICLLSSVHFSNSLLPRQNKMNTEIAQHSVELGGVGWGGGGGGTASVF